MQAVRDADECSRTGPAQEKTACDASQAVFDLPTGGPNAPRASGLRRRSVPDQAGCGAAPPPVDVRRASGLRRRSVPDQAGCGAAPPPVDVRRAPSCSA
ncbi:hypothetical protein WT98_04000 [Burkholderia territorii]|nr:hypothetical protein WT98_04000 [Burkholderia territorii]